MSEAPLWRAMKAEPRCGSCKHWGDREGGAPGISGDYRPCTFRAPSMPFWALMLPDSSDHGDWTHSQQGKSCATWESIDA